MTNRIRNLIVAAIAPAVGAAGLALSPLAHTDPDSAVAFQQGEQAMIDYAKGGGSVSPSVDLRGVCGQLLIQSGHPVVSGVYTQQFLTGCQVQARRYLERQIYGQ
jgi:hypothetical protein